MGKFSIIGIVVVILLIAGNVYQFQNPKTIEVPTGTEQIDSTSYVKKSVVADQETIIDSLKSKNKAMAKRIQEQGDEIASYTSITGRLKTEVDSLEKQAQWNAVVLSDITDEIRSIAEDSSQSDSTDLVRRSFTKTKTFGNGLFLVDGNVELDLNPCGFTPERIQIGLDCPTGFLFRVRQDFNLAQTRDIKIDIATTVNEDKSRILTYATSPDFESFEYQSYTEYEPKKELPWFWIGLASGAGGAFLLLN